MAVAVCLGLWGQDECAFVCEIGVNKTLDLHEQVSLSFNNEIALFTATNPEAPSVAVGVPTLYKTFDDNADVPSITGTYVMPSTPSGAIETTDTTGLGDVPDNTGPQIDPGTGQPKGSTGGGDGGLVNQEAGSNSATGCSVAGVMESMRSGTLQGSTINGTLKGAATFLLALFGLVPIGWRRVRK